MPKLTLDSEETNRNVSWKLLKATQTPTPSIMPHCGI
jgi:hypothetical protein